MGDGARIQPVHGGKRAAHSNPLEPLVLVAGVGDGLQPRGLANLLEFGMTPAEQRPDETDVSAGRYRPRAHSSEAPHPGPPRKAHEYRLSLVLRMVGSDDRVQASLFGPIAEQAVALVACPLLDRGFGHLRPAGGERCVAYIKTAADACHERGFARCLGAKAVVD